MFFVYIHVYLNYPDLRYSCTQISCSLAKKSDFYVILSIFYFDSLKSLEEHKLDQEELLKMDFNASQQKRESRTIEQRLYEPPQRLGQKKNMFEPFSWKKIFSMLGVEPILKRNMILASLCLILTWTFKGVPIKP